MKLFVIAGLLWPSYAGAIVLHPGVSEPTVKPADGVVGRWYQAFTTWKSRGSVVAVGREGWATTCYVITTRHQGGNTGASVYLDDVEYKIATDGIYSIPDVDLRICRLETLDGDVPNLTDFALLNTVDDEVGKSIVMGGYGKGRLDEDPYPTGYYNWSGSDNETLRWGTNNNIDSTWDDFPSGSYSSDTIRVDFDASASEDAAIAEWDSGGGWFYQDDGDWLVAGLSAYVTRMDKSYYSPSDSNWAIRVSSYAPQLDAAISDLYPSILGDANLDGDVDPADYTIWADNYTGEGGTGGYWTIGDFNFDGAIDPADYTIWADNYGATASGTPADPAPEPASLGLLGAGIVVMLRRRKK